MGLLALRWHCAGLARVRKVNREKGDEGTECAPLAGRAQ